MTPEVVRERLGRSVVKAAHDLLSRMHQAPGTACVFGWPDFEENSLVAAVALAVKGFEVTLLVEDPDSARHYLALRNRTEAPVELVRKSSVRGLWRASTASVLLITHGLYGSPDLTARRVVINLWHGYGPKATANRTFARRIPFGVMTCNSPVYAAVTARALGEPDARIVRTGNPRLVAFNERPDPEPLRRLGLGSSPFVLWMPTHRGSNGIAGPVWQDSVALSGQSFHGERLDPAAGLARAAQNAGVEVLVKPHPLDADRYERSGLRVVTSEEILDAGMTLYQFIGSSTAMISDYSSVWVEYLHLDRPLVLYCPDISEYVDGRGLNEPYMTDIAGGLIVERTDDLMPFFQAVHHRQDWRPEERAALRDALLLPAPHTDVTPIVDVVLDELDRRAGRK
jgi:hypothetical protein